jgi:hypothetical protein
MIWETAVSVGNGVGVGVPPQAASQTKFNPSNNKTKLFFTSISSPTL